MLGRVLADETTSSQCWGARGVVPPLALSEFGITVMVRLETIFNPRLVPIIFEFLKSKGAS